MWPFDKYKKIEVEPDPIEKFDPYRELLRAKDEQIMKLESEKILLIEQIQELRNVPKEEKVVPQPVTHLKTWSDIKRQLQIQSHKRALERKGNANGHN